MAELPKIVVLAGDDWKAMYIDGKRVVSGHGLHGYDVLEIFKQRGIIDYKYAEMWPEDADQSDSVTYPPELPDNWREIPGCHPNKDSL